jgi:hypothetical protein
MLRVQKGSLIPADGYTQQRMREKGYVLDDVLAATLTKPRNPAFNRLVHAFGQIVAENIEAFEGLDAHKVLKRLQIEANIGCDEVPLNFPGIGPCTYRVPRSLSFVSMDDGEFKEVFQAMCTHVAKTYWQDLTAEQIEEMAQIMADAV